MLHDVIHEMDPSERFQYAQLLAYLASVDGEISRIEMAFYEQRLGATLLSPGTKATTSREHAATTGLRCTSCKDATTFD